MIQTLTTMINSGKHFLSTNYPNDAYNKPNNIYNKPTVN